jgi:hypothetical protein
MPLFYQSNREQLLSIFYNHGNFYFEARYLKARPKSAKSISKMFWVGGGAMHVHVHHQRSRSFNNKNTVKYTIATSVRDPDSDPQDPHVFGTPGSGSINQRYGSGSGSESFPKSVERTEIMLAK